MVHSAFFEQSQVTIIPSGTQVSFNLSNHMSRTATDFPSCPIDIQNILLLNVPGCPSPFTSWDIPGCPDLSCLEQWPCPRSFTCTSWLVPPKTMPRHKYSEWCNTAGCESLHSQIRSFFIAGRACMSKQYIDDLLNCRGTQSSLAVSHGLSLQYMSSQLHES